MTPNLVRPFATTRPPPIELVGETYFAPLMSPTPVGTRVPRPADTADTISGFLRLEAGGGSLRGEQLLWDVSIILHAYAPNTQEAMAEQVIGDAVAWGANAQGSTIVTPSGDEWYVTWSRCTAFVVRRADPAVNLTRYRSMITWRIPGLPPHTPGQRRIAVPAVADASNAPRPSRRR